MSTGFSILFEDDLRPVGEPSLRLAAYAEDGSLAGIAEAAVGEHGERWKDRAGGFIAVAPAQRGRGLGTLLIKAVESFASGAGVRWLDGEGRERELRAVTGLLGRRGYVELERYQASRQEPGSVDISRLEHLRQRLQGDGIETSSFHAIDSR